MLGWFATVAAEPVEPAQSGGAAVAPSVVLLGASYAEGWTLTLPGNPVINKGVTGQQTFELLARFDRDVVGARPRAVIVWGFINDVFRAPEGKVEESLARARKSLEEIVGRARAAGIEPILATEVTLRTRGETWSDTLRAWVGTLLGRSSYQETINQHVLATNDWLRGYAKEQRLLLLDLQPVVSDSSGARLPECAKPDGSHISDEGYRRLSAYAEPLLRSHFASRTH